MKKADWELWAHIPEAELWQLVALSLDLEPDSDSLGIDWRPADYSDPFEDCPGKFKLRMKIALAHLRAGLIC